MAVDNWPSNVPHCFVLGSFEEQLGDGLLRSQTDTGPAKIRRRSSAMPRNAAGTLRLTSDELKALIAFIQTTLMGGALPFIVKRQGGNGRIMARFTDMPSWTRVTGRMYYVSLSLEILADLPPLAPVFDTAAMPAGREGIGYSWQPKVIDGTRPFQAFAITAGALPAGMSLNTATGLISGTAPDFGTFNFTLRVTDADGRTASVARSLVIRPPGFIFADGNILDPTFTRASVATYWGRDGVMRVAANDVPRFDYDPVSGAFKGVLVEEARTNLFPGSAAVGGSGYSNTGLIVTQNAAVAPDGTSTASLLVESTATSEHRTLRAASRTGAVDFWNSVYVKAAPTNTREWVYVWCGSFAAHDIRSSVYLNVVTGEVSSAFTTGTGPISDFVRVEQCANGWFRVFLRGRTVAAGGSPQLVVTIATPTGANSYAGDGISGVLVWGYQTEDGLSPTSYIPTTTAAATRAAELATVVSDAWFNQNEGTFVVEYQGEEVGTGSNFSYVMGMNLNGATTNYLGLAKRSSDGAEGWRLPSALTAHYRAATSQRKRSGLAWNTSESVSTRNGDTVTTGGGLSGSLNRLFIGSLSNSASLRVGRGYIRSIRYLPRRVSDSELQDLTQL